ncbi:NVEALA domain-containing protein [Capnocytophaga canis]|uniref:NVEALA domain-containing protein n=1 Tax=Capnocytophaga canis TaxID=1848903 RepID=UPI0021CDCA4A|nr:NVEALA domain-containing protein [Capnocytophaga canis]
MFKSLLITGIVAISSYGISQSIDNDTTELSGITLANIEALADGEGNTNDCSKNGYKKWFATTNIPTQRKEVFRDCWCNSAEGYDPQACSVN